MTKRIKRIVLTGGPGGGKTSLLNLIKKEFADCSDWRVITVPETATELISGFGIGPFEGCMSMRDFQYYVISDQLHKAELALNAAQAVPQSNVLIVHDRAVPDDKAYVSDEEFSEILSSFGKTEQDILSSFDAVIHMQTSAKGAPSAYNLNNQARTESIDYACVVDDNSIHAWSNYPNVHIIENTDDFEKKMQNAMKIIYKVLK